MHANIGRDGYAYVKRFWQKNENMKVLQNEANNNLCALFASSNGVWNPNNIDGFMDKIERKDKYEWIQWGVICHFRKIILLRDVFKEWYVNGINGKIDSIEKLIEFLKSETEGYELVTIGNSAGGYLATIIGIKLHATHIINFSGQNTIVRQSNLLDEFPELFKGKADFARKKFYDITELIANSKTVIFYFYAADCKEDVEQFQLISQCSNVKPFAFRTREHGVNMYPFNLPKIVTMDRKELLKLHSIYLKKIDPFVFMIQTLDIKTIIRGFFPYMIYKYKHKIKRRLQYRL